jgi:hypothetical protein
MPQDPRAPIILGMPYSKNIYLINIQEINLMIEIPSSDFSVDHFHRKKAIMGSLI